MSPCMQSKYVLPLVHLRAQPLSNLHLELTAEITALKQSPLVAREYHKDELRLCLQPLRCLCVAL
jgi:hypothetical protein